MCDQGPFIFLSLQSFVSEHSDSCTAIITTAMINFPLIKSSSDGHLSGSEDTKMEAVAVYSGTFWLLLLFL